MTTLTIKVLGPGCKNCERVEVHARQAIDRFQDEHPDHQVSLEKIAEIEKFADYGLLSTPGLVINERLVSSGRIPSPSQIVAWLEACLE